MFARLYENNATAVLRYAWTFVRDGDMAEDVCAETFLRAWRARGSFRGDATPLSWLLSIARNCALSELRRKARGETYFAREAAPDDSLVDPGPASTRSFEERALHDALGCLTEAQRRVIFLRFFAGLPAQQAAGILGLSAGAVRALQCRALSRLRRSMEASNRLQPA